MKNPFKKSSYPVGTSQILMLAFGHVLLVVGFMIGVTILGHLNSPFSPMVNMSLPLSIFVIFVALIGGSRMNWKALQ